MCCRHLAEELGEKSLELIAREAELREWKTEALQLRGDGRGRSGPGAGCEDSLSRLIQDKEEQVFMVGSSTPLHWYGRSTNFLYPVPVIPDTSR